MNESSSAIAERGRPFQAEAAEVLRQLRTQVAALFAGIPGGVRKSRDVQKVLGVDARLSWQLFKLAGPGEAMTLAPHVPSATSMRRLLAAAVEHGIGLEKVEGVRRAFDAFEHLVETHAGDRTSFDSMARGFLEGNGGTQSDLLHRKAIFKGHSHYYGAQTQTLVVTQIVGPGARTDAMDVVHVRSRLGQRRLRPDADAVVDTVRATVPNLGEAPSLAWVPLDADALARWHAPVLPDFCTRPLPTLRTTDHADGTSVTELVGDAVGRRSAVDMVFGQMLRGARLTRPDPAGPQGFATQVAIASPTALLIFDMLVHRRAFPRIELDFDVLAYGNTPALHARLPTLRLPFSERIASLGSGVDALLTRELPRYPELVEYACRSAGWDVDDLAIYRAKIDFPMLDTFPTISVRVIE